MGRRFAAVVMIGGMVLAACGESTFDSPAVAPEPTSTTLPEATTTVADAPVIGALPDGPSALDDMSAAEFPPPLVDPIDIISGGPPPDGIPPIDDPVFLDVSDNLQLIPAQEPVVALEINGDARAYPIRAMVWHEIVNDTVGGVPVSVTYCPLCNSAATYERTIAGNETTFGTSGRLYASALVMYDRATESLWTHYDGRAIVGVLTGTELVEHASPLLSWGDFRAAYPTGLVLDWTESGNDRDYGRNPYTGYDDPDNVPFLFRGVLDERARAMERVVGVELAGASSAFTLEGLRAGTARATNVTVGGEDIVILWKAGQASALESRAVSDGRDIGSVAVFLAQADGQPLTLLADGETFIDAETGSEWSITGRAIGGELAGAQLEQVPHLDTFWFVWSTYQPGTDLIDP